MDERMNIVIDPTPNSSAMCNSRTNLQARQTRILNKIMRNGSHTGLEGFWNRRDTLNPSSTVALLLDGVDSSISDSDPAWRFDMLQSARWGNKVTTTTINAGTDTPRRDGSAIRRPQTGRRSTIDAQAYVLGATAANTRTARYTKGGASGSTFGTMVSGLG